MVAFDKTGTITEDGLDLYEVIPSTTRDGNCKFEQALHPKQLKNQVLNHKSLEVVRSLASCHTLTNIEGKLCGDPLDLILFEATGWNLIEPEVRLNLICTNGFFLVFLVLTFFRIF